ncbi:hypothetical protein D3C80_1503820 [compost metagenome]
MGSFVGCENVAVVLKLNFVGLSLPRLVVIRITPLAPRAPYTAVDAISLSTVTLSTSFGSMLSIPTWLPEVADVLGTPSTTINGVAEPDVVLIKTVLVSFLLPGAPFRCLTIKPGVFPVNEVLRFMLGICCTCLLDIVATAPATASLFCVP